MRFSLIIKLFLIVVLVFAGILLMSVHQIQAAEEGESCSSDQECEDGAICINNICKAGLFTRGQSRACVDEGNCSKCDLLMVVKNVFQLLVQIAGALAVLSIVVAGVMYMVGGGALGALTTQAASPGVQKAKNALTAAIVGLLIVLFAWSMITWMMHFLGYTHPYGEAWYKIQCGPVEACCVEDTTSLTEYSGECLKKGTCYKECLEECKGTCYGGKCSEIEL